MTILCLGVLVQGSVVPHGSLSFANRDTNINSLLILLVTTLLLLLLHLKMSSVLLKNTNVETKLLKENYI